MSGGASASPAASSRATCSPDTTGTGITASYNAATGILTLSGTGHRHYQSVLRAGLTYLSTSEDPNNNDTPPTAAALSPAASATAAPAAPAPTGTTTRLINIVPISITPRPWVARARPDLHENDPPCSSNPRAGPSTTWTTPRWCRPPGRIGAGLGSSDSSRATCRPAGPRATTPALHP